LDFIYFRVGFGAGLANFAASGGVNFYFIHDRPLAEGVLGGGVCVGMVVFSRMLQLFSHCYTWKVRLMIKVLSGSANGKFFQKTDLFAK